MQTALEGPGSLPLVGMNPKPPAPPVGLPTETSLSFAAVVALTCIQSRFPEIHLANKSYDRKEGFPSISFSQDLPLELFDRAIIRSIVNFFACFIDIDERTKSLTGLNYARACVELDVLETIQEKVWISLPEDKGFFQKVVVEGTMAYCTRYKKHGHLPEDCRKAGKEIKRQTEVARVDVCSSVLEQDHVVVAKKVVALQGNVSTSLNTKESFRPSGNAPDDRDLPIVEWVEFKSQKF